MQSPITRGRQWRRLLSTIGAVSAGAAAIGTGLAAPAHAVVNGDTAPYSIAQSIARTSYKDPATGKGTGCSGTLIDRSWVLTARHCANPLLPGQISVSIGQKADGTGAEYRSVTTVRIPPDDPDGFWNDVMLLHLSSPSAKPPMPIATPADRALWDAAQGQNLYAMAVGWGYTSCTTFETGKGCTAGTSPTAPMAASVKVEYDANATYRFKRILTSKGTGYVCQGDSGSPLMILRSNGTRAVAGVLSTADCKGTGSYMRVGEGADSTWIRAQLRSQHGTIDFDGDDKADVMTSSGLITGGFATDFSSGGAASWSRLGTAPKGVADLRFGDFNGDGITDIMTAVASSGGYQYKWSPSGRGSWINMAWDYTPLKDLRFGDFDGDGSTDLFSLGLRSDGTYQWRFSRSGLSSWVNIAHDATPLSSLRFGDFDGDGYTDVFRATPRTGGGYQWQYSTAGRGSWTNLAYDATNPADLRFGDFDGDSRTDVFSVAPRSDGGLQWRYSPGARNSWVNLGYDFTALSDLRFGDFDGNGRTDVFTIAPEGSGYRWKYSAGGTASWRNLAFDTTPLGALRVGDLYGQP